MNEAHSAIIHEALGEIDKPLTHVFLQAGVGGLAAAVAGHLAVLFERSTLISWLSSLPVPINVIKHVVIGKHFTHEALYSLYVGL